MARERIFLYESSCFFNPEMLPYPEQPSSEQARSTLFNFSWEGEAHWMDQKIILTLVSECQSGPDLLYATASDRYGKALA